MLKIERKLIDFIEKHMYLLGTLLCTLLALYLRKMAVWWNYGANISYFDMHSNYTQTVTYYLLVRLTQYLPLLPLHSIKWLAGLADFGIAGVAVYLLGREANASKRLIFFIACLFSPILFLRGITWGQIDSVGILLLLTGYVLHERNREKNEKCKKWAALAPVIFAVALCPWLLLIVILYMCHTENRQQDFWIRTFLLIIGVFAIQLLSAALLQGSWKESFFTLVRFLTYHPESGEQYDNIIDWLLQLLCLYGPAASILTLLAAGRRKFSYIWAILIQIIATVLCGAYLFREFV